MGISIDELSFMFGDNLSVLADTYLPHFTFKNKSSIIKFHCVYEGVARMSGWRHT